MKATIEPTEQFFMAGDVMVRMWRGTDEHGTPIAALVAAVTYLDEPNIDAGAGLVSIPPPTNEDAIKWATTILDQGGF